MLVSAAYNLGVGGETTDGLKCRFENELLVRCHKKMKLTVLMQYGLNDMVLHKGKNRVPIDYFKRNLASCIWFAKERKIDVGLMTLHPFKESLDGNPDCFGHLRTLQDVNLYNDALSELAKEYNAKLIDVTKDFKSDTMLAEDGIHPNALGHHTIAKVIERHLFSGELFQKE
jgi:lysophospholipase L1-like esterase